MRSYNIQGTIVDQWLAQSNQIISVEFDTKVVQKHLDLAMPTDNAERCGVVGSTFAFRSKSRGFELQASLFFTS